MGHRQETRDPGGAEDQSRDHDRVGLAVPGQRLQARRYCGPAPARPESGTCRLS
jgi:hypothetical protein